MADHACCAHPPSSKKPFYRTLLFWSAAANLAGLLGGFFIPSLRNFQKSLLDYWGMMVIPLGLGFLFGGVIDYFIPREYISKHLAQSSKRTVFFAAGLGFLMSACNHGILALSMELHKKGASGPAVISFLLASPWANLPVTMLLVGFFHWKGLLIIFLSLLTAMSTGLIFQVLAQKGWIESNPHTVKVEEGFSIRKDMAERFKNYRFSFSGLRRDAVGIAKGIQGLAGMVLGWVTLGVLFAGLSAAFVPAHFFHHYMGPGLGGLLITIAASAVLEVCSEGTSPLAFEIYKQTGALGNAFVFLMGGVVTDYTEIGLVWKNIGPRTALWMVAVNLPQVIILGWLLNRMV